MRPQDILDAIDLLKDARAKLTNLIELEDARAKLTDLIEFHNVLDSFKYSNEIRLMEEKFEQIKKDKSL